MIVMMNRDDAECEMHYRDALYINRSVPFMPFKPRFNISFTLYVSL
jgi:hypothetical protein